jgi:hypothetical protein
MRRIAFCLVVAAFGVQPARATEIVTYSYDAKGRVVKVVRTGTVNNNVITEYQHDKVDNRKNVKTTGSANAPPP